MEEINPDMQGAETEGETQDVEVGAHLDHASDEVYPDGQQSRLDFGASGLHVYPQSYEYEPETAVYRKGMHGGGTDVGYPHNEHSQMPTSGRDAAREPLPPDSDTLSPFADAFAPAGTPFAYSILMSSRSSGTETSVRKLARLRRETRALLDHVVQGIDAALPPAPTTVVRAVHPYTASQPDELTLSIGDDIVVLDAYEDDWALGLLPTTGQRGAFPLACTVRFDDEVLLAHIHALQSQLDELSAALDSSTKAKSLPKATRHKVSPGEELIAKLHSFTKLGSKREPINVHATSIPIVHFPSKSSSSPEQQLQDISGLNIPSGSASSSPTQVPSFVTYDLFFNKEDPNSKLIDLTTLDFRLTALETVIGTSLPPVFTSTGSLEKSRTASTSSNSSQQRVTASASGPSGDSKLPLQSSQLLQTLSEATEAIRSRMKSLEMQPPTPPADIDTIVAEMQHLLTLRETLQKTPLPILPPGRKDAWQKVTKGSRRAKGKPALPAPTISFTKVQGLYEAVNPHNALLANGLTQIMKRLEALSGLHERGSRLSDAIALVRSNHSNNLESTERAEGVLETIERGLKMNADACERNFEAFGKRISQLKARLDSVAYLAER